MRLAQSGNETSTEWELLLSVLQIVLNTVFFAGWRSALHYASGIGNYEVVKMLLNNFANVNLLAKVSVL